MRLISASQKETVLYTAGHTCWNMNSFVWAVWTAQAVRKKKVDLSYSEELLRVFFQIFEGKKDLKFF